MMKKIGGGVFHSFHSHQIYVTGLFTLLYLYICICMNLWFCKANWQANMQYWCHGSVIGFSFIHRAYYPPVGSNSSSLLPHGKTWIQGLFGSRTHCIPTTRWCRCNRLPVVLGVESSTPLGQVGWNLLNQPVWRFVVNNLIFHHVFFWEVFRNLNFSKTLKGCVTFLLGIEGMMKYSKLFRQFCVLKLLWEMSESWGVLFGMMFNDYLHMGYFAYVCQNLNKIPSYNML